MFVEINLHCVKLLGYQCDPMISNNFLVTILEKTYRFGVLALLVDCCVESSKVIGTAWLPENWSF